MGGGNRGNLQTENRWLCFLQKYVSSWPLNSHGLDGARCGATGDFPRRRGEVLHALPAECIPAARPAGRGASQAERMLMSGLEDRFARNIPGSFTPRTPQWHLQPLAFDRRGAPGKSACPRTDCILEGGAEREECSPRIAAIYFWETSEGPGLGCARLSRDCSGRPSPARGRRDSRRPPVPHVRASSSKQSGNQRCGGQGFERGGWACRPDSRGSNCASSRRSVLGSSVSTRSSGCNSNLRENKQRRARNGGRKRTSRMRVRGTSSAGDATVARPQPELNVEHSCGGGIWHAHKVVAGGPDALPAGQS
jgi:hypothetical protein